MTNTKFEFTLPAQKCCYCDVEADYTCGCIACTLHKKDGTPMCTECAILKTNDGTAKMVGIPPKKLEESAPVTTATPQAWCIDCDSLEDDCRCDWQGAALARGEGGATNASPTT